MFLKLVTLSIFLLVMPLHASNDMRMIDYDKKKDISKIEVFDQKGNVCDTTLNLSGVIKESDCIQLTNSKGIKIFCTAKKRICKTEQELLDFIPKNEENGSSDNRIEIKEGMPYSKAREIILTQKWKGKNQKSENISEFGEVKILYFKNDWQEIQDCAGTGLAPCRFEFTNAKSETLVIITQGECVKTKDVACEKYVSSWSIEKY